MGRLSRKPTPVPSSPVDPRCATGHVQVGDERECLRCDAILVLGDRIAYHVPANYGELADSSSVASIDEWGVAG